MIIKDDKQVSRSAANAFKYSNYSHETDPKISINLSNPASPPICCDNLTLLLPETLLD